MAAVAVDLTGAFRSELRRMQRELGGLGYAIRLRRRREGSYALEFDVIREDDIPVVDDAGPSSVVVSRALAAELDGAILHFPPAGDDRYGEPGVVVLRPRPGMPRCEWSPHAPVRANAPLWTRVQR